MVPIYYHIPLLKSGRSRIANKFDTKRVPIRRNSPDKLLTCATGYGTKFHTNGV
jgi:hypothetical protein